MPRVIIEKDGKYGEIGWIQNGDDISEVEVLFPVQKVKEEVEKFLQTEREFWIPESQQEDDYRVEKKKPIASFGHLQMSLCEITAAININVEW
jgi:hypothetical protein